MGIRTQPTRRRQGRHPTGQRQRHRRGRRQVTRTFRLHHRRRRGGHRHRNGHRPRHTTFLSRLPQNTTMIRNGPNQHFFTNSLRRNLSNLTRTRRQGPQRLNHVRLLRLLRLPQSYTVDRNSRNQRKRRFTLDIFRMVIIRPIQIVTGNPLSLNSRLMTTPFSNRPISFHLTRRNHRHTTRVLRQRTRLHNFHTISVGRRFQFIRHRIRIGRNRLTQLNNTFLSPVHRLRRRLVVINHISRRLRQRTFAHTQR